jgi:hypothetical protein
MIRDIIMRQLCLFGALVCMVACSEAPRATPGFQPAPVVDSVGHGTPASSAEPAPDQKRKQYEASLNGRLSYYAQLVDQDGHPVSGALIFISLKKLGWNDSKRWDIYTYSDESGRFSVVGGEGTKWYFAAWKKGYSKTGRGGDLRGPDSLISSKEDPVTVVMWKNTGFDRKKLVDYGNIEKRFWVAWPPPPSVKLDLVKGVLAKEGEAWDVEVGMGEPVTNPQAQMTREWSGKMIDNVYYKINEGKMTFMADPLPGKAGVKGSVFDYRYFSGVVDADLRAERLPLLRAEVQWFQFQSRSKQIHGIVSIEVNPSHATPTMPAGIEVVISGAINPTGSPALFEREPTDKDFSLEGYAKSE